MENNIAVIVDSACNLPAQVLEKYRITRIPLYYSVDGNQKVDPCKDELSLKLFKSGDLARKHVVTTNPPTAADFERHIIRKLKEGYKTVLVQTVNRVQGDTYKHANIAASAVQKKLGDRNDIAVRVMDSRTVFSGQGVMVLETVRRMLGGQDGNKVKRSLDRLTENIHSFVIPREPLTALERSQKRNEKAVGWAQTYIADKLNIYPTLCIVNDSSYLASKAMGFKKAASQLFAHAASRIEKGLLCPFVVISYGGPLTELKALPGYDEMVAVAERNNIKIIPTVMSLAGGIYTSVGSISLALATEPHQWGEK
jgi:DegV family protein with EDD domain